MSNLWDLSHIRPQPDSVLEGETISAMFWNAAAQRADKVWLREKHLGIWRSWTWAQTAEAPAAATDATPVATSSLPFVVGDIRVDGLQRIGAEELQIVLHKLLS